MKNILYVLLFFATLFVSSCRNADADSEKTPDEPNVPEDRNATEKYLQEIPERMEMWKILGCDYENLKYSERYRRFSLDSYDFDLVDYWTKKLEGVDRREALKKIFLEVTKECKSDKERHSAVWKFVSQVSFHNKYCSISRDGMAIYDPLILLEISEMHCGQVNRLAIDLFASHGYKGRVIQVGAHVLAEIYWENAWHVFDASLFSMPIEDFPSVAEISRNANFIDAFPSLLETRALGVVATSERQSENVGRYASFFYFNKQSYSTDGTLTYTKTATTEEEKNIYYGWNYYKTEKYVEVVLNNFMSFFQSDAPEISYESSSSTLSWTCNDKDNDIVFHRIHISPVSRGWSRKNWRPEMWDSLNKELPGDIIETTANSITIPNKNCFVTVEVLDKHGIECGRKIFPCSDEIEIKE